MYSSTILQPNGIFFNKFILYLLIFISFKLNDKLSTDWLNFCPNVACVKLDVACVKPEGRLSTFSSKHDPNLKCVKLEGKLSTDWSNKNPNVKCVKLEGKLYTFLLK